VIDEYHGRGIGRLLLEALVVHASQHGITTFTATVLSTNEAMINVLAAMGATLHWDPDDHSVLTLEIPVTADRFDGSRLHALLGYAAAAGSTQAMIQPTGSGREIRVNYDQ